MYSGRPTFVFPYSLIEMLDSQDIFLLLDLQMHFVTFVRLHAGNGSLPPRADSPPHPVSM